ncbi:MAG: hypothetical protein J6Y94_08345, partial [Bacteriovoracaceae bacterium]|nr:hypothetical protein [Bacteriovoracaceae bacterium]
MTRSRWRWPLLVLIIMGGTWCLGGGPAQAFCVFMQNFAADAPEFANYVRKDFYYSSHTQVIRDKEYGELPVPTKVKLAGENCYIFKTYEQLKKYIQQGPPISSYHHATLPSEVILPPVLPGEPILIHHISHGGRCGEVEAGDILMFAKVMGIMHPIALTNNACFASDLMAKMLIEQQQDPHDYYIGNFCLMTVSPFSHVQMELDHDGFDQSTAAFIAGMDESTRGMSFADYYRQHNFYQDLQGQKRPLGIISAANWDELGLTDYLKAGEEIFNFTKMKFPFTKAEEIMRKSLPALAAAFFPVRHASPAGEVQRGQVAANLINHVNELLNADFAQATTKEDLDPKLLANRQYLYLAANN